VVIKGTLDGFFWMNFFVVLPGQELNLGSWDRIPTSYHLTTLTPYNCGFFKGDQKSLMEPILPNMLQEE